MNQEIAEDISSAVVRVVSWFERTSLYTLFTEIPQKKNISYITHAWRHAKQSVQFGYLAICLWIHAFFPFLCSSVDDTQNTPLVKEKKELPNTNSMDIADESEVDKSVLKREKENLDNGTAL